MGSYSLVIPHIFHLSLSTGNPPKKTADAVGFDTINRATAYFAENSQVPVKIWILNLIRQYLTGIGDLNLGNAIDYDGLLIRVPEINVPINREPLM